MQILVLTDTTEYGPEATLYQLVRELCRRPDVAAVYIADRAIPGNEAFYTPAGPAAQLQARRADESFSFASQGDYRPVTVRLDAIDAVWLRLDLASDEFLNFVTARFKGRFISNSPAGIIRTGTKAFLPELQMLLGPLMPRIALCSTADEVEDFRAFCPDMVLKVVKSFGGKGVVRYRKAGATDLKNEADVAAFLAENGACLAMEYLDNSQQSDNRLVVLHGEILGVIRRTPKPGEWLCNLMAGGTFQATEPDAREKEIVKRLHPVMESLGVHYYGADTLLNADGERVLSEVNTINSGGAYRYEIATGVPVCRRIADSFADDAKRASGGGRAKSRA